MMRAPIEVIQMDAMVRQKNREMRSQEAKSRFLKIPKSHARLIGNKNQLKAIGLKATQGFNRSRHQFHMIRIDVERDIAQQGPVFVNEDRFGCHEALVMDSLNDDVPAADAHLAKASRRTATFPDDA